ncbi:MAG: hypothetical protein ACREQ5_15625 [Candidatus Dormibacteria bacterium]
MKTYRQGDVLIIAVAKAPKIKRPEPLIHGRVVLAFGEVTGHAHALAGDAAVLTREPEIIEALHRELVAKKIFQSDWRVDALLEIADKPGRLQHEEHGTIELPAGRYAVIRQREYSPEELRQVAD